MEPDPLESSLRAMMRPKLIHPRSAIQGKLRMLASHRRGVPSRLNPPSIGF